ncbi:hypothetical protein [Aquimarina sp. 2201CG14-23]|uniref:hypothetical protein n=1 Tax=Aquimarina mycalae TaxID=3040073 RepID=UPI00247809B5|nr:hypothetical protein [Aquimarina sp. 2201CG14-23]MDH7448333.1 hypothetical protein [Aquimarina sp. 2201CG14-23]
MSNENLNEFKELQSQVLRLKKEVKNISARLKEIQTKKAQEYLVQEEPELRNRFRVVLFILIVCIILTALIIIMNYKLLLEIIWICILSGILGSSVSALISVLQRKANGWEFKNGMKYPDEFPKDKFSVRMSTFFAIRPILGILSGFIIYYGFQIIGVFKYRTEEFDESNVIFWSLLAGLFAKSMIEKLKDVFKNLIGT